MYNNYVYYYVNIKMSSLKYLKTSNQPTNKNVINRKYKNNLNSIMNHYIWGMPYQI